MFSPVGYSLLPSSLAPLPAEAEPLPTAGRPTLPLLPGSVLSCRKGFGDWLVPPSAFTFSGEHSSCIWGLGRNFQKGSCCNFREG